MIKGSNDRIRRFARDESGLIMTEFLILLPLLLWTFVALVVWWDAWRTINEGQKASYAIADLVSRQSEVSMNYINGMETVMEGLLGQPSIVSMRITSVQWHEVQGNANGRYSIIFSRSANSRQPRLTSSDVNALSDLIPVMNPGDSTVILETWISYTPPVDVGLPKTVFRNFIVTKPRFYRRVCLTETPATCPAELS